MLTIACHSIPEFLAIQANAACAIDKLASSVAGFGDTLPAFKQALPGRNGYGQEVLVKDLLGSMYDAHDAVSDVAALEKLVSEKLPLEVLAKHCVTLQSAVKRHVARQAHKPLLADLLTKVPKQHLSQSMAEKVALSGLGFADLQLAFQRNGKAGIDSLLSEKGADGKPRVTRTASVIQKLASFFEVSAKEAIPATEATQATLSAEKLALFEKRRAEGYDIPDPDYLAWLAAENRS